MHERFVYCGSVMLVINMLDKNALQKLLESWETYFDRKTRIYLFVILHSTNFLIRTNASDM